MHQHGRIVQVRLRFRLQTLIRWKNLHRSVFIQVNLFHYFKIINGNSRSLRYRRMYYGSVSEWHLHQLSRQFQVRVSARIDSRSRWTFVSRFKKGRLLRSFPRRPVLQSFNFPRYKIELLLLHCYPRPADGLGHSLPGLSSAGQ